MSEPSTSTGGNSTSTGGNVAVDRGKNKAFAVYFIVMFAAGVAIMVAGYFRHWGFWGWFGGGLLIFTGVASLGSMAKTGGAGKVTCPKCAGTFDVLHITIARTQACPHCGTYLEGAANMTIVPADRVSSYNPFETPLPEKFSWPEGCPVCAGPTTRTIKVEGMSDAGVVALVAAPVAVARVSVVQAPACAAHDNGVALRRQGSDTIICFRSIAYWNRFRELNPVERTPADGKPVSGTN